MRAFKNKWFTKWAREEGIPDSTLWQAAEEVVNGRVEADLGRFLYKKRVAKPGKGKSGGYRLILVYRKPISNRIFFISAFSKNEKSNLKPSEIEAFGKVAAKYVSATDSMLADLIKAKDVYELEVNGDEQTS